MINMERVKEVRIKRANTDWWIHEKAMVGMNGLTYIAYVTDMGEIHVKEMDTKCSRSISRDVCICRLNCNYSDEHNAPSMCVLDSGKIIVVYTGHAANPTLKYRITERPYDIMSFGPERELEYGGTATYAQLSYNTKRKELWLFTRVSSVTWEFRYSKDEGETWSEPTTFLKSDKGGLFYFDIRKQYIRTNEGVVERWFFALYGHPRISADHTIRSGMFDANGYLCNMDGEPTEKNLFEGAELDLNELAVVYDSPEGTTVRLLVVSPTEPYRIGLCPFVLNDADSAYYTVATYKDGAWKCSKPIATVGEFLSKLPQMDGSQTYVGGMAFYYGVGEAGLHHKHWGTTDTNRVYVARFDGEQRLLESYVTHNEGETYELEQVIRAIPKEQNIKIWRPTVPTAAQDNMPVYWHEGTYSAHTGGWHCDTVMYVEYDD